MVVSHQASDIYLADSVIHPLILFIGSLLVSSFLCSFLHSVVYCLSGISLKEKVTPKNVYCFVNAIKNLALSKATHQGFWL